MKLLSGAAKAADIDEVVGPLESAGVQKETVHVPYEETGAVAAILLGIFLIDLAVQFLTNRHFDLVFSRRDKPDLSLWPVIWAYGTFSLFLFLTAKRFTRWFAPAGVGHIGRIILATLGIFLITESFQPLVMVLNGLPVVGRWGNVFSSSMDPALATYGPLVVGLVLILTARFLPKVVVAVDAPENPSS